MADSYPRLTLPLLTGMTDALPPRCWSPSRFPRSSEGRALSDGNCSRFAGVRGGGTRTLCTAPSRPPVTYSCGAGQASDANISAIPRRGRLGAVLPGMSWGKRAQTRDAETGEPAEVGFRFVMPGVRQMITTTEDRLRATEDRMRALGYSEEDARIIAEAVSRTPQMNSEQRSRVTALLPDVKGPQRVLPART